MPPELSNDFLPLMELPNFLHFQAAYEHRVKCDPTKLHKVLKREW